MKTVYSFLWLGAGLLVVSVHSQESSPSIVMESMVVVNERSLPASDETVLPVPMTTPAPGSSLEALTERVANFHLSTTGAGSFGNVMTLRGLSNTPYFSDPAVVVYFDDLPLGGPLSYPTELFGFQSASLLRGPQGTTLGRGGEAGALLLRSQEPLSQATGSARVGIGSNQLRSLGIEARSPREERIDIGVVAFALKRNGIVRNTVLDETVGDQMHQSLSVRLRLRPTQTSEYSLQYLGLRQRDGAQPLVPLHGPFHTVERTREGRTESDFDGIALKAAFDLPLGEFTLTTSRTEWGLNPYENQLILPPPIGSHVQQGEYIWSEELRLVSSPSETLQWQLGGWWSLAKSNGEIFREIPEIFPIEASSFRLRSRVAALLGEIKGRTEGGWTFVAGMRLERTQRDFVRSQTIPGLARFEASRKNDMVLPKLAAVYDLSDRTKIHATLAMTAKSGGWSAYTSNLPLAGFSPEKVTTSEVAINTALLDKSLRLSGRAFFYEIRDYQIERSFTAADYLVVNAPRANASGGELEFFWQPTTGFTFVGALGVTHIVLREFVDPFTGRNYTGTRAPYTPNFELNLVAAYRQKSGLFTSLAWNITGRTNYVESEDPNFSVGAHSVFSARLGYERSRWWITTYAENLFDARYYTLIVPGVGHGAPNARRSIGIETGFKW